MLMDSSPLPGATLVVLTVFEAFFSGRVFFVWDAEGLGLRVMSVAEVKSVSLRSGGTDPAILCFY